VGLDHKSREIRTFAVARIRNLEATEKAFEVPESFDFDTYIGSSFGVIAEPATRVRIRFDRRWASYVEERTWHPSQSLGPAPAGGVELTMEVGGTAELRSWVLSFGSGAEVLEPESLRGEVEQELADALQRYIPSAPSARASGRGRGGSRSEIKRRPPSISAGQNNPPR